MKSVVRYAARVANRCMDDNSRDTARRSVHDRLVPSDLRAVIEAAAAAIETLTWQPESESRCRLSSPITLVSVCGYA
jgi:hypothetical protein